MLYRSVFFGLILLCSLRLQADALAEFENAYQHLLSEYTFMGEKAGIKTQLIHYRLWSLDKRHQQALLALRAFNPTHLSNDVKKAFWINAYNFLTIDLIIKEQERDSIKNLGILFVNPWRRFSWPIADKDYSLHFIEHEILRPMLDPRIHMAINCASLSCPDIRNSIYDAETLDEQLDEQTRLFISNPNKGLSIDGKVVKLSRIFSWYKEDFTSAGGVNAFIARYYDLPKTNNINYLDYNWDLNGSWQASKRSPPKNLASFHCGFIMIFLATH
jgi:hypothetical protein